MLEPIVIQLPVGGMENFCYLLADPDTRQAAVVDPAWEKDTILKRLRTGSLRPEIILLTHTHGDHCNLAEELSREWKVPIAVHRSEAGAVSGAHSLNKLNGDGEIRMGGLSLRALHTPGHTPGSTCYAVGKHLFTGDTLFVDACGRCDLPGSSPKQLYESLRRLASLPEETAIYPGHDYGPKKTDTIGGQKRTNPYFQVLDSYESFFRLRAS